jgi:hypothetical protein
MQLSLLAVVHPEMMTSMQSVLLTGVHCVCMVWYLNFCTTPCTLLLVSVA